MSKQKKLIFVIILLAILLMGVSYAALANVTLTISGKATATATDENFKVYFTGENTKKSSEDPSTNVEVNVDAQAITATVNFSGLTKKDDEEYAILEILNASNDVDAKSVNVAIAPTGDTSIIEATAIMCDATGNAITDYAVASGSKTYVKVSAKLLKTPTEDAEITLTATITAEAQDVTN